MVNYFSLSNTSYILEVLYLSYLLDTLNLQNINKEIRN